MEVKYLIEIAILAISPVILLISRVRSIDKYNNWMEIISAIYEDVSLQTNSVIYKIFN